MVLASTSERPLRSFKMMLTAKVCCQSSTFKAKSCSQQTDLQCQLHSTVFVKSANAKHHLWRIVTNLKQKALTQYKQKQKMTVDSHVIIVQVCVGTAPPRGIRSLRPRLAFSLVWSPCLNLLYPISIKKLINTPSPARSADKAYDSWKKKTNSMWVHSQF